MKNTIIFFTVFLFSSCTLFNEGQLTERERYIMQTQMIMSNTYNENRKPIFEIELPDGGTLPEGFKLSYYGEQEAPRLTIPKREYHPVWNVLNTAIPLGFGYLMTRENNNTWERIFQTAAQFDNRNNQPTYSSGDNSPITIGDLDQSDSSVRDNSTVTTRTNTEITNTSTIRTDVDQDLDYNFTETTETNTTTTETNTTDSYNTLTNEQLDYNYSVEEPIVPVPPVP